jgi:hypothetical protein
MDNPNLNIRRSKSPRGGSPDDVRRQPKRAGTFFQSTLTTSLNAEDFRLQSIFC